MSAQTMSLEEHFAQVIGLRDELKTAIDRGTPEESYYARQDLQRLDEAFPEYVPLGERYSPEAIASATQGQPYEQQLTSRYESEISRRGPLARAASVPYEAGMSIISAAAKPFGAISETASEISQQAALESIATGAATEQAAQKAYGGETHGELFERGIRSAGRSFFQSTVGAALGGIVGGGTAAAGLYGQVVSNTLISANDTYEADISAGHDKDTALQNALWNGAIEGIATSLGAKYGGTDYEKTIAKMLSGEPMKAMESKGIGLISSIFKGVPQEIGEELMTTWLQFIGDATIKGETDKLLLDRPDLWNATRDTILTAALMTGAANASHQFLNFISNPSRNNHKNLDPVTKNAIRELGIDAASKTGRTDAKFEMQSALAKKFLIGQEITPENIERLTNSFVSLMTDSVTEFSEGRVGKERHNVAQRAQAWITEFPNQTAQYWVADVKNLGGLNSALGDVKANDVFKKLADIFKSNLQESPDAVIHFYRHGGDEISAIVVNAQMQDAQQAIQKMTEEASKYIKDAGLSEIPHAKHEEDLTRRGSGINVAVGEIKADEDIKDTFERVGEEIERLKKGEPDVNLRETAPSEPVAPDQQAGRVPEGVRPEADRVREEAPQGRENVVPGEAVPEGVGGEVVTPPVAEQDLPEAAEETIPIEDSDITESEPSSSMPTAGMAELRHYTSQDIEIPTKPDANGLVWFTEGQSYLKGPRKVPGKRGYIPVMIPKEKILRIDEDPNALQGYLNSKYGKDGRSKKAEMEYAESLGYLAVKRGSDVAVRPETVRMFFEPTAVAEPAAAEPVEQAPTRKAETVAEAIKPVEQKPQSALWYRDKINKSRDDISGLISSNTAEDLQDTGPGKPGHDLSNKIAALKMQVDEAKKKGLAVKLTEKEQYIFDKIGKEGFDASRILEDQGAVQAEGVQREASPEARGQDMEQQAPVKPGREGGEAEVTPISVEQESDILKRHESVVREGDAEEINLHLKQINRAIKKNEDIANRPTKSLGDTFSQEQITQAKNEAEQDFNGSVEGVAHRVLEQIYINPAWKRSGIPQEVTSKLEDIATNIISEEDLQIDFADVVAEAESLAMMNAKDRSSSRSQSIESYAKESLMAQYGVDQALTDLYRMKDEATAAYQKKVGIEPVVDIGEEPKPGTMAMAATYQGKRRMSDEANRMASKAVPIDTPGLVRLVRGLTGKFPSIVSKIRSMGGTAVGLFRPQGEGKILIRADVFKGPLLGQFTVDTKKMMLELGIESEEDAIERVKNEIKNAVIEKYPEVSKDDIIIDESKRAGRTELTAYKRDESFNAEVLAHEIGHLDDYLPDKNMGRGNILGRIASLKQYLSSTIEDMPESATIKGEPVERGKPITSKDRNRLRRRAEKYIGPRPNNNIERIIWSKQVSEQYQALIESELRSRNLIRKDQVMDELKDLTLWWQSLEGKELSDKFKKYLFSSEELFANAVSVLLNAPQELEARAPVFHASIMNYMENKPEFMRVYDQILNEINAGESGNVILGDIDKGYQRSLDEHNKVLESKKMSWSEALGAPFRNFYDKFNSIKARAKQAKKMGYKGVDPTNTINDAIYSMQSVERYVNNMHKRVGRMLQSAGIEVNDFSTYLMIQRALHERKFMANPYVGDVRGARTALDALTKKLGNEKMDVLEQARKEFTAWRKETVVQMMKDHRAHDPDLIQSMDENEYYATYEIVDHIAEKYGAQNGIKIHSQIGTYKEASPALDATMAGDISMMVSLQWNKAKRDTCDFLLSQRPEEIEKADFNRRTKKFSDTKDPNKTLLVFLRDGEMEGYYVPNEIGLPFSDSVDPDIGIAVNVLRAIASPARLLYTGARPGFWLANMIRDYQRTVINLPGARLTNLFPKYLTAMKEIAKDVLGMDSALLDEMRKNQIMMSWANWDGLSSADTQYERLLKKNSSLIETERSKFKRWWSTFLEIAKSTDRLGDVAGYMHLKENQQRLNLTDDQVKHMVRYWAGSPSFITRGKLTPFTNNIFLFSNAMIQGVAGDIDALRSNPVETGIKHLAYGVVPKIAMVALGSGIMLEAVKKAIGDDDDEESNWFVKWLSHVKKMYDGVTDYDMTNYTVIPFGLTPEGKTVYLRIPMSEQDRFFGGMAYKLMGGKGDQGKWSDLQGAASYMADQGPGINPAFGMIGDTAQLLFGQNPYDEFRQRPAIPEKDMSAGGKYKWKAIAKYMFNAYGPTMIYRFPYEDPTKIKESIQEALELPFAADLIGRFIKVTDYGIAQMKALEEKNKKAEKDYEQLMAMDAYAKRKRGEELTDEESVALSRQQKYVLSTLKRKQTKQRELQKYKMSKDK